VLRKQQGTYECILIHCSNAFTHAEGVSDRLCHHCGGLPGPAHDFHLLLAPDVLVDGRLDAAELDASAARIVHLKDMYAGEWDDVLALPYVAAAADVLKGKHSAPSAAAYGALRSSTGVCS